MDRDHEVERVRSEVRRGLDDPDGFFSDRGFQLECTEIDGEWWAELSPSVPRYGRGATEREAKDSAVRRWMVEEDGPDLRRRPGEPLP